MLPFLSVMLWREVGVGVCVMMLGMRVFLLRKDLVAVLELFLVVVVGVRKAWLMLQQRKRRQRKKEEDEVAAGLLVCFFMERRGEG